MRIWALLRVPSIVEAILHVSGGGGIGVKLVPKARKKRRKNIKKRRFNAKNEVKTGENRA
jgi:hypothetical protein